VVAVSVTNVCCIESGRGSGLSGEFSILARLASLRRHRLSPRHLDPTESRHSGCQSIRESKCAQEVGATGNYRICPRSARVDELRHFAARRTRTSGVFTGSAELSASTACLDAAGY
jgi:hypothetical protein